MFKRFVLISDHLQFAPLSGGKNAWGFLEAVGGNGRAVRIWKGAAAKGNVAMKAFVFCYDREDAARLEMAKKSLSDDVHPQLFAVTAFTREGAMTKALDACYLNRGVGAERIA